MRIKEEMMNLKTEQVTRNQIQRIKKWVWKHESANNNNRIDGRY